MSITRVDKDFDNLTIILVADFPATVERVWQLWADPRQLERWWGPPGYPATMEEHDLSPGGTVTYYMTAPDGRRHRGWWRVTSASPPKFLEFIDGFADSDGAPAPDMPTTTVGVRFTEHEGGTRMEVRSVFDSREQMDRSISMGSIEGFSAAVGQMDVLLDD
jgi:uncharacterized protein YndB with AHSA1/START domain